MSLRKAGVLVAAIVCGLLVLWWLWPRRSPPAPTLRQPIADVVVGPMLEASRTEAEVQTRREEAARNSDTPHEDIADLFR